MTTVPPEVTISRGQAPPESSWAGAGVEISKQALMIAKIAEM